MEDCGMPWKAASEAAALDIGIHEILFNVLILMHSFKYS